MRRRHTTSRPGSKGFTLLELMITVAIVGILATVAYPAYMEHVQRSKRTEGMAALMQAAQQQERYFTTNNTYTLDATKAKIPLTSEQGSYALTIEAANGDITTGFIIRAKPDSSWTDSKCGELTFNNAGVKGAEGPVADCWK